MENAQYNLKRRLRNSISEEPIEEGVSHPAEQILMDALTNHPREASGWISQIYQTHFSEGYAFSSGILRCIGRLNAESVSQFGLPMVRQGLKHPHSEVRDSAVRALEHWGGSGAIEILSTHVDEEAWINDYIARVIKDLTPEA